MASSNRTIEQSFIIALSVFAMLTIVLAVTTYLYFKKADEAEKKFEAKQREAGEINSKMLAAEKDRLEIVKAVLGLVPEGKSDIENITNKEIFARKRNSIDDVYGKYLERPTYSDALEWLSKSLDQHFKDLQRLQQDKDRLAEEKNELVKQHESELKKLQDLKAQAERKRQEFEEERDAAKQKRVEEGNKAIDESKAANDRVKKLKDLSEVIAAVADATDEDSFTKEKFSVLSDARKKEYVTANDTERVELLKKEIIAGARQIRQLKEVLDKLRVADQSLQKTVRAATPTDERIDGFDGRILSVNELDRTVLVSFGSTSGLRAGLLFDVYAPDDPRPQLGSNKAVLEVIAIESDSLVRCRVRKDSIRDPIVPGDMVGTNLWSPGMQLEVVIVGMPIFGGSPESDRQRLEQLVQRIGGTVAESLSPSTTMVVDAGLPPVKRGEGEGDGRRRKMTEKEKKFREDQMKAARQMGIRVMTMEPFLESLGLQVEAVRADRLPVPVDSRAPRGRTEGISF